MIEQGVADVGDELEIVDLAGGRRKTTLVGIDLIGRRPFDPKSISLILRPLERDQIEVGYSVVTPGYPIGS
ncbi:hypothetical protein [Nocardia sp. XZ_19_385]|uniref:hypothetical protein n=1 Tax=Nocardia sp. XZ_19_385 TaxID=2769488 RepID=UPI00189059CF|nr:hypothetical protein [Nocardia sp. XZ_19_385]